MLIYNKNKQSMVNHTSNQASASMLSANPTGITAAPPAISHHNNFVKSSGLAQ